MRVVEAARHKLLRAKGWTPMWFWIPPGVHESLKARAAPIKATQAAVARAAVIHGLRSLPASVIVQTEAVWREIVGPPVRFTRKVRDVAP